MNRCRILYPFAVVALGLFVSVWSISAMAQDPPFQTEVSNLPISGGWINATAEKRQCSGVSATSDVVGSADFDLTLKDKVIELATFEYDAKFTIQRVREGAGGLTVIELSGVANGMDETERVRALWFLKRTENNEQFLTIVEWIESIQAGGQEVPDQILDPVPNAGTYIRCFN